MSECEINWTEYEHTCREKKIEKNEEEYNLFMDEIISAFKENSLKASTETPTADTSVPTEAHNVVAPTETPTTEANNSDTPDTSADTPSTDAPSADTSNSDTPTEATTDTSAADTSAEAPTSADEGADTNTSVSTEASTTSATSADTPSESPTVEPVPDVPDTNIFEVGQFGVRPAKSKKIGLSFGQLDCIVLGEEGRGRVRTLVPSPKTLKFVVDGLTKSGKPRLNAVSEHPKITYLIWLFEAGYRGYTSFELPEGCEILATGWKAQGDAGRMGGHQELLLKVDGGNCVIHCKIGGRTYRQPDKWTVIVKNHAVSVMPTKEYELFLDTQE